MSPGITDQNGKPQPEKEYVNASQSEKLEDQEKSDEEEAEEETDEESEEEYEPPYSVEQLAGIFLAFYKFLATLHYDPSNLKVPPPEGWPMESLPAMVMRNKSPRAIEVMRHIPYFKQSDDSTHVHYKSKLHDYTDAKEHHRIRSHDELALEMNGELESFDGEKVDPSDVLVIAWGYESGGHYFLLDALRGEMTVDVVRCQLMSPEDVADFFDGLREEYRSLRLIPCPNKETELAERVDEREEPIEQSEVLAQEEEWGTDLDWQFVRQIYRQHGWPDAFRREEAIAAVEDLMELLGEERDGWEGAFN
jgi:hypothetical protein